MTEYQTFLDRASGSAGGIPMRAPSAQVPVSEIVLASPVADGITHARPVAEAICGSIQVHWHAETPLLVGGAGAEDDASNRPFKIDKQFYIPGSSLRGMIRALMESATYSRLAFFDDVVGYDRDFTSTRWQDEIQGHKDMEPTGGWLFKTTDKGFQLLLADRTIKYPIKSIEGALKKSLAKKSIDWHNATLHERLGWIEAAGCSNRCWQDAQQVQANESGRLVVSGQTPEKMQTGSKAKLNEALFFWPSTPRDALRSIDENHGRRFVASLHHDAEADRDNPRTNYSGLTFQGRVDRFGEGTLANQLADPDHHGLPVFWRNKRETEPGDKPVLSLTALYRVAGKHSIKDIAEQTQRRTGNPDDDTLDFTQGLFGWAPPGVDNIPHGRKGIEAALRSRVKFGFAKDNGDAEEREAVPAALSRPRATFYPFYLAGKPGAKHPVDFFETQSKISGRKRYMPRDQTVPLPRAQQTSTGDPAKRTTQLRFLDPTNFSSEIRVHNISQIELGALIWCLTFGQLAGVDNGYRHMLGRAKAWGYGQIRAEVDEGMSKLKSANCKLPEVDLKAAVTAFQSWLVTRIAEETNSDPVPFEDLEPIAAILRIADRQTGKALSGTGALEYARKGGADDQAILNAYTALKKRASGKPDHEEADKRGISGRDWQSNPTHDDFIGLPAYPARPDDAE